MLCREDIVFCHSDVSVKCADCTDFFISAKSLKRNILTCESDADPCSYLQLIS